MDAGSMVALALVPLALLAVANAFGFNLGLGALGDFLGMVFSGSDSSDSDGGGDGGGGD